MTAERSRPINLTLPVAAIPLARWRSEASGSEHDARPETGADAHVVGKFGLSKP